MTTPRRLAAILAADVVGYSRLMEANDAATLGALKAHRIEFIDPLVEDHGGRIVKLMGDGALVEFPSVVDAVECAVAVQRGMTKRNASTPEERRIVFRIGVNLGDVIIEGEDIYGDGVNVAARLEALAEPGGICVSGTVHEHIASKLDHAFTDDGEQTVKNISRPVHVWRWSEGASAPVSMPINSVALPLPDKPSIAVLPFDNMSGDPEQDYFADGITEDIITELSRFRSLFVIARNSSFAFKGQAIDIKEIRRKLDANYILEGSVRKAGDRVRITAQLIDGTTGNHIWAERYDRRLEDILDAQDEVVRAVSGTIPGHLDRITVDRLRRTTSINPTSYDCELRARWAFGHWNEGLAVALEWYKKAIAADPSYALAHAGIAMTYAYGLYVLSIPPNLALMKAKEHAEHAVRLDDRDARVLAYAAFSCHVGCEPALALHYAERAVALNANDPFALYVMACALTYGGQPGAAVAWFEKAERLEPYATDDQRLDTLCDCYFLLGDYDKIIEWHALMQVMPPYYLMVRAATYAKLGDEAKAREAFENYYRSRPSEHDPMTMIAYQMRMFARQEDRDHWLDGYRKAGFDV